VREGIYRTWLGFTVGRASATMRECRVSSGWFKRPDRVKERFLQEIVDWSFAKKANEELKRSE